jgi:PAS domain S-box-containing protein
LNRTLAKGAIILAPRGRDAAVAQAMLREAGLEAATTPDLPGLVRLLRGGASFAIVTEEAVRGADLREIAAFITDQAEWSDFPFILLTERGGGIERNPAAVRLLETLGNVTFLERPFHPTTLISLARSALRARLRQYEARSRLEAIREGEERLRLALDAGGLGSWVLDIPTRTVIVSDTFKAQFGRRADEAVDYEALVASIHPDDLALRTRNLAHSLETGEDYLGEYRCIWPDGSVHWIETRGRIERGADGKPLRMVGVLHDITDRRDAENALAMFAAELEERVEQRTAEREAISAQLHEAQKLETLGQLTGGVAHDFNNLLTPVIGNLDMMRRVHEDERSQRLLGSALEAAERAKTLVSRLLSFARRQTLQARPIDTVLVIGGMLDFMRRTIGPQKACPRRWSIQTSSSSHCSISRSMRATRCRRAAGWRSRSRASRSACAIPLGLSRGATSRCGSPIPAPAWTRRHCAARSSRSTRPKASARAPGSACRWSTASPRNRAAR